MGMRVAILFNPRLPRAEPLARELAEVAARHGATPIVAPSGVEQDAGVYEGAGLVLAVGGDGTIIRATAVALALGAPVVGVNLGELGFMAELSPEDAPAALPSYLDGQGWLERRALLRVETFDEARPDEPIATDLALNEVLLGRGARARVAKVRVTIDGAPLTTYVADGVLAATPTGSTAYSLAAGGPILDPATDFIVLNPLLPYLSFDYPIVLPGTAVVSFHLFPHYEAVMTIDGQVEKPVRGGFGLRISIDPRRGAFLRQQPRNYYWATLTQRLRYRGQG